MNRFARLDAVYRVKFGGVNYIIVKGAWLKTPTKVMMARFNARNSKIGPDSVSSCFYCPDPLDEATVFDETMPFILADQIYSQVVIIKHPCMDTAVVLDPRADFFENIVEDAYSSSDDDE